ncbi:hypothetical protein [Bermanella sp. R86510]|uniref:hypothetical protein n=1 Tax=unclassified Bermanella TaxID=2627862 RepID=UPI0037C8F3E1
MDTQTLVIIELSTLILVIFIVAIVMLQDKRRQIRELYDVNEALLQQIEELQSLIDHHQAGEQAVANDVAQLSEQVHDEVTGVIQKDQVDWQTMANLSQDQLDSLKEIDGLVDDLGSQESVDALKKEVKTLEKSLKKSQETAEKHEQSLKKSKATAEEMKLKIRELTSKSSKLKSLEGQEQRLLRDQERLKDRLSKMRDKYETQNVIAKNLRNELKTSFRADEVKAIRDQLKETENKLAQSLVEKQFIENHFVSLDEIAQDRELLEDELKRARREIQTLERSIIELDQDSSA